MKPTLGEFAGYLICALIVLVLIPVAIVLMLGFTIMDAGARLYGRWKRGAR